MKKLIIVWVTVFAGVIVVAQKPYDPLTDPLVQKPESMMGIYAAMLTKQEAILKETPIGAAASEALIAGVVKTNVYQSVFDLVAVKNYNGNKMEAENEYNLAKQSYYQVVWSKNTFPQYPKEDARVGFYYFKTCYDLGRLLSKMNDYKNSYEFYKLAAEFYKKDSSLYFAAVAGMNGIKNKTIPKPDSGFYNILRTINGAVELKPGSAAYISTRGQYYWDIVKDTAKALSDFSKAVQLNPKDDASYEYMAIINYYKSNINEAINNISKCIEINKREGAYFFKRAFFYTRLKNYDKAIPDYDEAIFWEDTKASYYTARAECYDKLQNYPAAYDDYGFVTMLDPNDTDSKKELQRLDPLLKAAYEKMGFTPQNAFQFFLKRADRLALLSEGFKLGPAIMNYYKCIQVEPKNPLPYNKAGVLFSYLKMNAYAEQFLRYAAYADGKNPEYFFHLAKYYAENAEDYKKASGCYDTAALLGSVNVSGYVANGEIKYLKLNNNAGALKDFNTALSLEPANKNALAARAYFYYEIKNYKAALTDFEAFKKLDPGNEENNGNIKICKEKLNE